MKQKQNIPKILIDIRSISSIRRNKKLLSPLEIISIFKEEGILYYDGEKGIAPIVVKKYSSLKLIDISKKKKRGEEKIHR